ncbi:hypothetical protein Tco_0792706 [Tanacetum coccineum]
MHKEVEKRNSLCRAAEQSCRGRVVDEGRAKRQKGAPGRQSTSKWFWLLFPLEAVVTEIGELMKLGKVSGAYAGRHGTLPGGTTPAGWHNGLTSSTLFIGNKGLTSFCRFFSYLRVAA